MSQNNGNNNDESDKKQLDLFSGLYGLDLDEINAENQRQAEKRVNKIKQQGLCPKCLSKGRFSHFALYCDYCKEEIKYEK